MSLRIPTRTLRTPRRPAGAERLVVRPLDPASGE